MSETDSELNKILTDTAESICGEWCIGLHEGAEAVREHMNKEFIELQELIATECRKAAIEELTTIHSNQQEYGYEEASRILHDRLATLSQEPHHK